MNIIFVTLFSLIILFPQKNSNAAKSDKNLSVKKRSFLDSLNNQLFENSRSKKKDFTYEPPSDIDYKIKRFKPDSTVDYKILKYNDTHNKSFLNKLNKMNPLPDSLSKHWKSIIPQKRLNR